MSIEFDFRPRSKGKNGESSSVRERRENLSRAISQARRNAIDLGCRSTEIALRRAVIALSRECGLPTGLSENEELYTEQVLFRRVDEMFDSRK